MMNPSRENSSGLIEKEERKIFVRSHFITCHLAVVSFDEHAATEAGVPAVSVTSSRICVVVVRSICHNFVSNAVQTMGRSGVEGEMLPVSLCFDQECLDHVAERAQVRERTHLIEPL